MIAIDRLSKRFGKVPAVDELTFEAPDGAITGLLGPNGAGKTTTLRVLGTLMRADSGAARVDGVDAGEQPLEARRRMGLLTDARGLYPRLTAVEHVAYFAELHGLEGALLRQRTDELVELLDMRDIAGRRAEGFSQGERMKVSLARALVHRPRNLVLDEPTNGLDVMSTRALREILRRLRDEGCAVLFSSHVMQEVGTLCDRIVVMARGRVVAEGTADQLRERAGTRTLEDAFVSVIGTAEGLRE
jgi:sodium transport system ATP-binding protein